MNRTFTIAAVLAVASLVEARRRELDEDCCIVYAQPNFMGRGKEYCIGTLDKETAYGPSGGRGTSIGRDSSRVSPSPFFDDNVGSIKCGARVDATLCLGDFDTLTDRPREERDYECSADVESTRVGANQEFNEVPYNRLLSSVILEHHPWDTKGADYLSLMREEKTRIIWDKITESDEIGGNFHHEVTEIDVSTVFDEWGDEMECRNKTLHSQGNVGKVYWVDKGGHDYTGIFEGGDSGFIRFSSTNKVVAPGEEAQAPFANIPGVMMPAIGLKFLRDGVDSANTFGVLTLEGQDHYNFFESSLTTIFEGAQQDPSDWSPIGLHFMSETNFLTSIGHSDFAQYTQDGTYVEEEKFPFMLRFEPSDEVHDMFPKEYEAPLEEQLQTIQPGTTLYKVFALDAPEGEEIEVAKLVLGSTLVTSLWGDEHMYFRHQRMDDDFVTHPEWMPAVPQSVFPGEEAQIRPGEKKQSTCPFAFLFQ